MSTAVQVVLWVLLAATALWVGHHWGRAQVHRPVVIMVAAHAR